MPSGRGPASNTRRRLLTVAVVATLLVVGAGLVGLPGVDRVRSLAGGAFGPLERLLAPQRDSDLAAARAERDRYADIARQAQQQAHDRADLTALLDAPTTDGATVLPAHVVGIGREGASGPQRITLDVGSRDGVSADSTVVSAAGLVGRVESISAWTCDVVLLGSPEVVVGVRVGPDGRIGTVSATGALGISSSVLGSRALRLELVEQGEISVGDMVTTLGSVDGRPFVAGVEVGRVTSVEPLRGRATTTAVVEPTVDLGSLGLVGILQTAPRTQPRPAATGGTP